MKKIFLPLITLFFVVGIIFAAEADPLRNPALTPVTIKQTPDHAPLKLVENGELRFAILVDLKQVQKSRQTLDPAIKLLQEAFRNTTGKTPKVFPLEKAAEAARKYPVQILLGCSRPLQDMGLDPLHMPREGFEIKTAPGKIAIAGFDSTLLSPGETMENWNKTPLKGTLWGTYDFVERFLGCRFYFPGEYGSVWPKITTLEIPPLHYEDHPYFLTRDPCWVIWSFAWAKKGFWDDLLGTKDSHEIWKTPFFERWRLAETTFRINHNPHPIPFVKDNPGKEEIIFYRSANGTLHYNERNNMACYFDILNMQFADLLIDTAKRHAAGRKTSFAPNDTFLCFGQADNELPLNEMICDPVVQKEKLITQENIDSGSPYSDIYARFYKYLGERVQKEFPGKWLYVMPYARYTKAPLRDWQLPDNLQVRVCLDKYPAWIPDEKTNAEIKKQIADWSKALGGRPVISLWLYNVPGNPFARAIVPEYVGRIPKILGKTLGRQDLFFDQYMNLEWYYYYSNYAACKSMWNPEFDVDAAIDEHWALLYGENAAPHLKRFHAVLKEMHETFFAKQNGRDPVYPKEFMDRLSASLADAEKAIAPDSIEKKRFNLLAAPWKTAFEAQERRRNYSRPVCTAMRIPDGETVMLDGKADEKVWQRTSTVPLMDREGKRVKSENDSEFRLAWDDKGIYILYRTKGKTFAEPEKSFWKNSTIEIFLAPENKNRYYHYAFSAAGQTYTAGKILLPVDMPYNPAWKSPGLQSKAIAAPDGNGWSIEVFIPYRDLNVSVPGGSSACFINLVSNTSEFLSSSMTVGNNHNHSMYGQVKFVEK